MADGPELPEIKDGPNEDVEIEITEDDLGENLADFDEQDADKPEPETDSEESAEEDEPEPEPEPRKKRSENRIQELARRAQEAERRAQEAEERLKQEADLRRQSDAAMMSHYEQRLQRDFQTVQAQLKEAISVGDVDQQIELQGKMMQLQTDVQSVEAWKAQNANVNVDPEAPEAPRRQPDPAPTPQLEPRTASWIQENTWFQPQSPDFDPEMHEEATAYAQRLERKLRREGRADEIGGDDYFAEIDQFIQTEFYSAPKKATPRMASDNSVAPVSRTNQPGVPAKQSKTVRLSADQRRMAVQLAESGAIRKPNGGRMTPAEAEKHYAVFLMKQNRR